MMKDIEKLEYYTSIFRRVIENLFRTSEEIRLKTGITEFPKGACYDSSCLLGQYLFEKGINTNFVKGTLYGTAEENECSIGYTHNWLEYKDIIIDITADQFKDYDDRLVTTKKDFHNKFENISKNKFEINLREIKKNYNLSQIYKMIIQQIENE